MDYLTQSRLALIHAGSKEELARLLDDLRSGAVIPDDPPTVSYMPVDNLAARINALRQGDMTEAADILRNIVAGAVAADFASIPTADFVALMNGLRAGVPGFGAVLLDTLLAGLIPPAGFVFLVAPDGAYLVAPDGAFWITEAA